MTANIEAMATLIRRAIKFADFAAGEGICAAEWNEEDPKGRDPEEFLMDYWNAANDTDFDNTADKVAGTLETLHAENERLRKFEPGTDHAELDARRAALEDAALWHDEQVKSYQTQIAENSAYMIKKGLKPMDSHANAYCADQEATHRRSAAAIRAMIKEVK